MSDFFLNNPLKYEHLIGKPFVHGQQDCYEACREIFRDNTPVRLAPYARPDDWWLGGEDLYLKNLGHEGFKILPDLPLSEVQLLDMFLIALPDPRMKGKAVTNHCAMYVGDGYVFHHRLGKLSQKSLYTGFLKDMTTHIIRHKDAPILKQTTTTVDVLDYLLPHKRQLVLDAIAKKEGKTNEN